MRVRTEHWQLLLNICEDHPELINNKFNGAEGKSKGNALWQSVTSQLNSLGFGEKTVDSWRKTFTDWKSKTKAKAAAIKRETQRTGGGPNESFPLSNIEEKLIQIMGTKSIYGDEEVTELGFGKVEIPKTSSTFVDPVTKDPVEAIESETSQFFEHDYIKPKERKVDIDKPATSTSSLPKKTPRLRRKPNQSMRVSNDLLRLNNETIGLLRCISNNTESIATSLKLLQMLLRNIFPDLVLEYSHFYYLP